ncbi:amidase [Aureimonas populi]|uniref:Amidase n=1 Tax=Aureimonas populi TaxID=1701758 RepID=A0ABW5CLA0_9HYPH|nr:amidase [Aureimonas populi]
MSHFAPLGLIELLAGIENGLSPATSIARAMERIEAVDGGIGAFATLAPPESLGAAAKASGPLAGVPLGIKDIFDTADMATAYGSPIHAGFRPSSDAVLVAMARAAGAAVMGKTVTTEFAFLQPAATGNPAAPGHTPGGSSSGSAAAVAAGMVAGAFGSQTAGSVIRPAAFCGVAGFKPSFRLLPTVGMKCSAWTLDTAGLFAATVADVAMLAERLSGRPLSVRQDAVPALRLGLYRSAVDGRIEPAMREAWETAARLAERAGARLVEIEEPAALARARQAQETIQFYESALSLTHERRLHADELSPRLREALEKGAAIEPAAYDEARRTARQARRAVTALFGEVDALLAPSALGPAPASLASTGDPVMNRLWTLTGNPCVSVPGLRASDGRPLGLSVVARFGRDGQALALASWLEGLLSRPK